MANKITKREVINAMLADEAIKVNEVYVDYLSHELELLDKKATNKKATKAQEANVEIKKIILATLATMSGTVTEIQAASAELSELSNQKISALLRQLCESGEVTKTVEKKKSIFSLTNLEVEGEQPSLTGKNS